MEMRIKQAVERGAVVDELGAAFQAKPSGEFLLMPASKDIRFAIIIYNIDIEPQRAVFSAGLAFRDSRSNQFVVCKADNISFYYHQGLTGPVKMYLLSDVNIRLGRAANILIKGGINHTWAEFACSGLERFGVTGKASINSNLLEPLDKNLNPMVDSSLQGSFSMVTASWEEMLIQISLQPFQVKGFKGYAFKVTNAVLDLNGQADAPGMPPQDVEAGSWEGFYLQEGKVIFPAHFTADSKHRPEFGFRNLTVDRSGFSGSIFGTGILDTSKGNLAGWRFGIDRAEITFLRNCLVKAQFNGMLGLPVLPDTQLLYYDALIGFNDNYCFTVKTKDTISIPALKAATVILTSGSQLYLAINEGVVTAEALLHGNLTIKTKSREDADGPNVTLCGVEFQGLTIANHAPKIKLDYLGVTGKSAPSDLNAFPLFIRDVNFGNESGSQFLGFTLGVNLNENLACAAGIKIYATLTSREGKDRWTFNKCQLSDLALSVAIANINLQGRLAVIRSDPQYGKGFNGEITFKVKVGADEINGACKVLFGRIRDTRYWYFDAAVDVSKGIPMGSAATLNGFLGGAWFRMRALKPGETAQSSIYGRSANGRIYVPDATAGMGLRAGVYLKSTAPGAFQGNGALEVQFMKGGGIDRILLFGTADFLTNPMPLNANAFAQKSQALCAVSTGKEMVAQYKPVGGLAAAMDIQLDFTNKTYVGNFGLYANVKTKAVNIAGTRDNGFAGHIKLFFGPTNWYVWIGNSRDQLALQAVIPNIVKMDAKAYFMTGKSVLPPPPLPAFIENLLGANVVETTRDAGSLTQGVAFSFGGVLTAEIGGEYRHKKVALYAKGMAMSGLDITLNKYNALTVCSETGERPGINGWFAQGKYYTGMAVRIGGSVGNLSIDVANISLGAVLQGQGPSPISASGTAAFSVKVVNLFDVNGRFRVNIGKSCEMVQNQWNSEPIIHIEAPVQGQQMGVLQAPVVAFSIPVETEFTDVNQRKLRLMPQYELLQDRTKVAGLWELSADKQSSSFRLPLPLKANAQHFLTVTLRAQVWNQNLKRWDDLPYNGTSVLEVQKRDFKTGNALAEIPPENIAEAYPSPGQVNLHVAYATNGSIALKVPQWQQLALPGTKFIGRFSAADGECRDVAVEVKGNAAVFSIPQTLKNAKTYQFRLLRRSMDARLLNVASGTAETTLNRGAASVSLLSGQASTQNSSAIKDAVLLTYYVRTSHYPKPDNKWQACTVKKGTGTDDNMEYALSQQKKEYCALPELKQKGYRFNAQLQKSSWFTTMVNPKLYGFYYRLPSAAKTQVGWRRDTSQGLIPQWAVIATQPGIEKVVLNERHYKGAAMDFVTQSLSLEYSGVSVMKKDLDVLKEALIGYAQFADIITLRQMIGMLPVNKISNKQISQLPPPKKAPSLQQAKPSQLFSSAKLLLEEQAALRNKFVAGVGQLQLNDTVDWQAMTFGATYQMTNLPTNRFSIGEGYKP